VVKVDEINRKSNRNKLFLDLFKGIFMLRAWMRLLLIGAGILTWVVISLAVLRFLGRQQDFSPIDHPLLKQNFLLIADGGLSEQYPSQSLEAFQAARNLSPEVILGARVYLSKDRNWVVLPSAHIGDFSNTDGYVRMLSLKELQQLQWSVSEGSPKPSPPITLTELLQQFSKTDLFLQVHSKDLVGMDQLIKILKPRARSGNLIVQSSHQGVMKRLKEAHPLILFGAGSASIGKASLLSSLYIESMAGLEPDLYLSPLQGPFQLGLRLAKEIRRRHKLLILQTNDFDSWKSSPLRALSQGVLTSDPKLFSKEMVVSD
jgi:glycerophosphoryl diester phosphodiesterase